MKVKIFLAYALPLPLAVPIKNIASYGPVNASLYTLCGCIMFHVTSGLVQLHKVGQWWG